MNVLSNRPLFICNGAKNIVTLKTMNLRSFFASHAYAQVFHHCSVSCHIKFSGVRVHWECLARLSSHGFAVPLLLIVMCCAVWRIQHYHYLLLAAASISSDLSTDHRSATPWLLSTALHYLLLFVLYCLSSKYLHFTLFQI